jgi:hypothetical protein
VRRGTSVRDVGVVKHAVCGCAKLSTLTSAAAPETGTSRSFVQESGAVLEISCYYWVVSLGEFEGGLVRGLLVAEATN